MPLRKGDGTGLINPHKGDGTGFTEIRKGDGTVLWSAQSSIADDAVSRWNFEDDSDTSTAIDSNGSNDGTINGATYTTDAAVGSNALDLDGTDDYVEVPHSSDIDFSTGSFSVSAWVETTDDDVYIVGKRGSSFVGYALELGVRTSNRPSVLLNDGSATTVVGNTNVNDGTYHQVGFAYDGSAVDLVVDGVVDNSSSVSVGDLSNNSSFIIGAQSGGGDTGINSGRELNGPTDDVQIYGKALTESEWTEVYELGN